ncbi:MAG: endolytic transglycosylase MltG, partial [Longimicrobiales bacterium]
MTWRGQPLASGLVALGVAVVAACGPTPTPGDAPVEFTVPDGAGFGQVVDTLEARGLVTRPTAFTLYARWKKLDREVKSGRYALTPGTDWAGLLDALTEGRVVTREITIPEGWTIRQIAPRIAAFTDRPVDEVEALLGDSTAHRRYDVPGPGLEGYLFPETYRFADGTSPETVVETMVQHYRDFWTPARRARLAAMELDERGLTTLASIVQAEARVADEMPRIAAVYHNRLRIGMLLQADPTVLYALGGPRERLHYAAMDSVADSPYNTYTQPGLPPGPIGSPGAQALTAALRPADDPALYFVAGPDGRHV